MRTPPTPPTPPAITWTVEADQVAHAVRADSSSTLCGLSWKNDGRLPADTSCPTCHELLSGRAA